MEESTSLTGKISQFFLTWGFLFLVWLAFTATLAKQEVLIGVITSFLIALITSKFLQCCTLKFLMPKTIFFIVVYILVFIRELLKANFDVARRVISPSLPINPGIVKFKTNLKSDYAKMVLANSITLTPGTLSVDIVDDTFYVHWIDVKSTDPEQAFKDIAESFEKILLKIF